MRFISMPNPRQWITHNMMGWFDGFDHYTVGADLDFASWDNYVGNGHLDPWKNGMVHDLTRGFKSKNFWVMETQPGNVNWQDVTIRSTKAKCGKWLGMTIGHGAEAVSYWQWRSALGGQEQYHGTLVGPDGKPVPLYPEVAESGESLRRYGDVAAREHSPVSEIAFLHSYDTAGRSTSNGTTRNSSDQLHEFDFTRPLRKFTDSIDVVNPAGAVGVVQVGGCAGAEPDFGSEAKHLLDSYRAVDTWCWAASAD